MACDSRFDCTFFLCVCPVLPFMMMKRVVIFHPSKWKWSDNSTYSPWNHLDAALIAFRLFDLCTVYPVKLLSRAR